MLFKKYFPAKDYKSISDGITVKLFAKISFQIVVTDIIAFKKMVCMFPPITWKKNFNFDNFIITSL